MRRAAARTKVAYATLADAQAGRHYAAHVDQPDGSHYEVAHVTPARMAELNAEAKARGIPCAVCYVDDCVQLWPAPAEGWRVFAAVSGRDVTP